MHLHHLRWNISASSSLWVAYQVRAFRGRLNLSIIYALCFADLSDARMAMADDTCRIPLLEVRRKLRNSARWVIVLAI